VFAEHLHSSVKILNFSILAAANELRICKLDLFICEVLLYCTFRSFFESTTGSHFKKILCLSFRCRPFLFSSTFFWFENVCVLLPLFIFD